MKIKEFLEVTFKGDEYNLRDKVICKDGYSVSIQGGTRFHYCSPRELCNVYCSVELGYPNKEDFLINQYAEDKDALLNTVYGFVPIEIVEELIEKHGGIVGTLNKLKEK